jgi:hypothetical protein
MKILGASLGELLRHGSQFGLGVQAAGRQNAQQQYDLDREKSQDEQKALLQQALLDQYQASAERDRAYGRSLLEPRPEKPEAPVSWRRLETPEGPMQENPFTGEVRPLMLGGSRVRPNPKATGTGGGRTRGETTADAKGYAEQLAAQMTSVPTEVSQQAGFDRAGMEEAATRNLLREFPEIGKYEAASMIRTQFRSILDKKPAAGSKPDDPWDTPGVGTPEPTNTQQQMDWDAAAEMLTSQGQDPESILGPRP